MLGRSSTEIKYIADSIANKIRPDSRKVDESRTVSMKDDVIEHCDGSLRIQMGNTDVIVGVRFKGSARIRKAVGFLRGAYNNRDADAGQMFTLSHPLPFNIAPYFSKVISASNLSLFIEVVTIHDDGGLITVIFEALRTLFLSINVPIFTSLRGYRMERHSLRIPRCDTVALFGDVLVSDPSFLEEKASDGVLYFMMDGAAGLAEVGFCAFIKRPGIPLCDLLRAHSLYNARRRGGGR